MSKMKRPVMGIDNVPETQKVNAKRAKDLLKKLPKMKYRQPVYYTTESGKLEFLLERQNTSINKLKENEKRFSECHPGKLLIFGEITKINN